ncbi:MAG TPA: hypothetical protein VKH18_07250, partial [Terriglobales bacterium]|nr:hypothetical protein [Terriglobales bacterium]
LLAAPRQTKEQPLLEEIGTQIEAELQNRDRPASDIIAKLVRDGYAKRSIERAKAWLILNHVMDKPTQRDGSWYWRLMPAPEVKAARQALRRKPWILTLPDGKTEEIW